MNIDPSISALATVLGAVRAALWRCLLVSMLFAAGSSPRWASAALPQPDKAAAVPRADMSKWLREGIPAGEEGRFDRHFNEFVFPQLLVSGKDLPKERFQFKRDYFKVAADSKAHARLNELALKKMLEYMANADVSREIKINAMMVIADLNQSEGKAKPYPPALPVLLKAVKLTKVDAFRVAGLIGIKYHADAYSLEPNIRAEVEDAMLELITSKPPAGRSPEGHQWMRRMAIEVLGAVGDVGAKDKCARAIDRVVSSQTEPMSTRCTAVQALGNLKFPAKSDFKSMCDNITFLVVDLCTQELTTANQKEATIPRRRLLSQLLTIRSGVAGLLASAKKAEDKSADDIDKLNKKLQALLGAVGSASDEALPGTVDKWLKEFKEDLPERPAIAADGKKADAKAESTRPDADSTAAAKKKPK